MSDQGRWMFELDDGTMLTEPEALRAGGEWRVTGRWPKGQWRWCTAKPPLVEGKGPKALWTKIVAWAGRWG